jgi:hypothetical protein
MDGARTVTVFWISVAKYLADFGRAATSSYS